MNMNLSCPTHRDSVDISFQQARVDWIGVSIDLVLHPVKFARVIRFLNYHSQPWCSLVVGPETTTFDEIPPDPNEFLG